jgi:hypothetical protein
MNPDNQLSKNVIREIGDWQYGKRNDTGELFLIRLKYKPLRAPAGISQTQFVFLARFFHGGSNLPHGVYILTQVEFQKTVWVKPACITPSDVLHLCSSMAEPIQKFLQDFLAGKKVVYEARLGFGEITDANTDEVFFYGFETQEMAETIALREKLEWIANWTHNLIECERREAQAKTEVDAKARTEALLKKFPARFPPKPIDFCHYKNRQDVLWELHKREWPRLFRAHENFQRALSVEEREKFKRESWLGYIADHKALYGKEPEVRQNEMAGIVFDDGFHRMWHDAMNSKRTTVDKRDWQLANWWIEKGYYRMNEKELEENFNRDWNCNPRQKGNTLARRARDILGRGKTGLISGLKPGRPEKPNALLPE